jgi:hypothetical protein
MVWAGEEMDAIRRSSTERLEGDPARVHCTFSPKDGKMKKADPPLSALGPIWCQIWCQNRAIFPVFTDFTGFFALCRQ